jgi:hypothetical protein
MNYRGNRSTRTKLIPVPLCRPKTPHYLSRTRTRTAVVGSRRITAYGMAYIYELFPFSGVSQIMLQYVFRALRRDDET